MKNADRIDSQPAFVLHAYPYRETSLIVETFTRDHGRMPLVARGARRAQSQLRGVLMEFQPLELAWFGRGEVRTLAKAEWLGGQPLLRGRALLYGYYLNELLLRLLAREDAHAALFEVYAETLGRLGAAAESGLLRAFELRLLRELGYGLVLDREAETGAPLEAERHYAYRVESGPLPLGSGGEKAVTLTGKALLAIGRSDFSDAEVLQQSKVLMRYLLDYYLGPRPLHSRRVFMELQEL